MTIHAPLKSSIIVAALLCATALSTSAIARDSAGEPGRNAGGKNPLNNVYFGEQHLHTQDSPDAFAMGTRNTHRTTLINFAKERRLRKAPAAKTTW